MKGIIFNLLEDAVRQHHGEDAWETVLDNAGVAGAYTSLGNYPHAELERLVLSASIALNADRASVLRWFGRSAMPRLAALFPTYFDACTGTRDFLLSLNGIIHPEVMKLYPGAHCPVFAFKTEPDGGLLIGYSSPRRLCMLAHGFIEGAASHFHEAADIEHRGCMHTGDNECTLRIGLSPCC